ncbi:MAG TPA: S8 family serine peptidase [Egibacteraceae bacterium]|nr:S8 family serine peptidase [Egibacteraceae bacterium]
MKHTVGALCAVFSLAFSLVAPAAAAADRTVDVIVVLDARHAPGGHDANKARAAQVAREHGVRATQAYGTALFGFAAAVPEGRLRALAADPRVRHVERDGAVRAFGEVAPWGVARIGLDATDRSATNTGAGIHVYVVDTGIDADHADLAANLGNGYAVTSCGGGGCRAAWDDDHGHGTHVAGTVGAADNDIDVVGVAPGVTLHAVKVLDKNGSGRRSGVIAGVDWAAKEIAARGQAGVVNMSLGGTGSKTGTCTASGFTGSDAYHESICNATHGGAVFAVAAGNSDADASGAVPAAYDDTVVTVSATQEGDDWPYWSNWGNDAASWASAASAPVAVAAPGRSVVSTRRGGGTTSMSGTSMAAPHVAGALALYLAANPQPADAGAFAAARGAMLTEADATSSWSNSSGNPHAEPFLDARPWAPATAGPVLDPAPLVAITSPAEGATVSGAVPVTADAADTEGVAKVEFFANGATTPFATDTDGTDGWSASWDSTAVADGAHTLTARATEQGAAPQTASASVVVTVDNPDTEPAPEPAGISLSATGYKIKGVKHADLAWTGATSTDVDIHLDGAKAATTANDGAATVNLKSKGGGTHRFQVCEAGTGTCSPEVSVTY